MSKFEQDSALHTLNRRSTLKGIAAVASAAALPAWRIAAAAAATPYDIIVVGGGSAGLPLAIAAAERGASVLIIEKAPILGGTLDRAGAGMSAAGSLFQKKFGIKDTPQDHFNDLERVTPGNGDKALMRLWTDNAAEMFEWLDGIGTTWLYDGMPNTGGHEPYTIPRFNMPKGQGKELGDVLQRALTKAATRGKVTTQFNTAVVDLIQDTDGKVRGVVARMEDGTLRQFTGGSVVLTSGGCSGNSRVYEELHRSPLYWEAGYPFNHGDGLMLGQAAGGYLRGAEAYCPLLAVVPEDQSIPSVPLVYFERDTEKRPAWEIWVNARGERFIREDEPSQHVKELALGKQPGQRLWAIGDQETLTKTVPPLRGWSSEKYSAAFGTNPMFLKADTLHQLGLLVGINPRALSASVENYNAALINGRPDPLGRVKRQNPILKPPYIALRLQGYALVSFAGIAVDGNLRVIRADGKPIPNLYAAGEVLGVTAPGGSGHMGGSMLTPAVVFGRLLGKRLQKA